MYPEKRLLIVVKHLTVKCFVIIIRAVGRILHPQRVRVIDWHRAFYDLELVFGGRYLYLLFLAVLVFFFLELGFLMDRLAHDICVALVGSIDDLCLLLGVCLADIDLCRQE